jgi:hypothetical protein
MAKILYQYAEADWGEYELEMPGDLDWVKNAVFERGDEFWNGSNGGSAFLYWVDETPEHTDPWSDSFIVPAELKIIAREEFGFIVFCNEVVRVGPIVLTTGAQSEEFIAPEVGGAEYELFREYCVTKETAWQAIEYFLKTGKRDPDLEWVRQDVPGQPRSTYEEAHDF